MKTAIITGVAGGLGYATALQFIQDGYEVYGLDIREPRPHAGLHFIQTDLTDADSVERAYDSVRHMVTGVYDSGAVRQTERNKCDKCYERKERNGDGSHDGMTVDCNGEKDYNGEKVVDCIINMAGMYDLDSLVEMPEEDFLKIFNLNLFASYRVNKVFLPLLREGGRIIVTTSELAPLDPLPFTGIYAITKTAVNKYAQALRMELQLLGYQVIVLQPGAVNTSMLGASVQALDSFCSGTKLYSCSSEKFKQIVDRVEARNIPPEKIAKLVSKAVAARRPKLVYKINRNPLLILMSCLPDRLQLFLIRKLLQ